ncbi:MAG: restriction endonuclease subunit S, partial [Alphaproteobacteria bacterium]
TYIDISAIDREERSIRNPQRLPGIDAPSRARQRLAADDVIVSTVRPNLNTVAGVTTEHASAIASTGFCVLRAKPTKLDSRYLLHWISSEKVVAKLVSLATGATYPAVSDKVIKSLPFDPPLYPEQRRVSAILDKADALRRKRQEAIRVAAEFVRSTFADMFGDPHTNARSLPTASLGEVAKLKSGDFLPSHEMAGAGDVLVYGGNGINGRHDRAMFDEVKLVIGRVGAYCGAVHLTKPRSWVTDNALYVSALDPRLRLEYLAFALTQANLNQYSSQSGQPLVSASRLYPVEIILPPLGLQDEFLTVLNHSRVVQSTQEESLVEVERLFGSLSTELLA